MSFREPSQQQQQQQQQLRVAPSFFENFGPPANSTSSTHHQQQQQQQNKRRRSTPVLLRRLSNSLVHRRRRGGGGSEGSPRRSLPSSSMTSSSSLTVGSRQGFFSHSRRHLSSSTTQYSAANMVTSLGDSLTTASSPNVMDFLIPPSETEQPSPESSSTLHNRATAADSLATSNEDDEEQALTMMTCPREVVPLILAYCGPQVAYQLSTSCRYFHQLMQEEATWKIQCQELYKWQPGDPEPNSWKELYTSSPCVPIDYPTVERAMTTSPRKVWLRPNYSYVLTRPILVSNDLVIETMSTIPQHDRKKSSSKSLSRRRLSSPSAIRPKTLQPRDEVVDETYRSDSDEDDWTVPTSSPTSSFRSRTLSSSSNSSVARSNSTRRSVAYEDEEQRGSAGASVSSTLSLYTRQLNTPVIWVHGGCLQLKGVKLHHACLGVDIWNGNAAIQVQPAPSSSSSRQHRSSGIVPPSSSSGTPPPPRALLSQCQITSQSGRGVVVMDGAQVLIRHSTIVHCAATGLYIGGSASPEPAPQEPTEDVGTNLNDNSQRISRAMLEHSRVSGNGVGSYYQLQNTPMSSPLGLAGSTLLSRHRTPRRRNATVSRGHSGVYLEQGECHVVSSVIRANALTGISAVSDHVTLTVAESQLEANGTQQLETLPSQQVRLENNRIVENAVVNNANDPDLPEFLLMMDQP